MKSDKNYFVCNRSLFKNPLWYSEKFTKGQAWLDLFGNANHSDGWFPKNGQRVDVKRGQTGRSIESLASDWKWSRNKVKRFLKRLESEHMIERVSDTKLNHLTSIITICNYDKYQFNKKNSEPPNEPPGEPPGEPPNEPQTNKKEGRNKKELKNTLPPEPENFEIKDSLLKWSESKGIEIDQLKSYIEICLTWHGSKGNQYKDWSKTIQTWINKDLAYKKEKAVESGADNGKSKADRIYQDTQRLLNE